jgi:hypothetical protein
MSKAFPEKTSKIESMMLTLNEFSHNHLLER